MITSIGVDIVDVARVQRLLDRYGTRFVSRILSKEEIVLLRARHDAAQFVAGRFAAKEALIKAFGKYLTKRPDYAEIEIIGDAAGRPIVSYRFAKRDILSSVKTHVSISHEKSHAVAIAILSEEP